MKELEIMYPDAREELDSELSKLMVDEMKIIVFVDSDHKHKEKINYRHCIFCQQDTGILFKQQTRSNQVPDILSRIRGNENSNKETDTITIHAQMFRCKGYLSWSCLQ